MGYTHRWFRETEIDVGVFNKIALDVTLLLPVFRQMGISLADTSGFGQLKIGSGLIAFNGKHECGHGVVPSLVNPWPSADGGGIGIYRQVTKRFSLFGTTLENRCCDGDCAQEEFVFPRRIESPSRTWIRHHGRHMQRCETGFRPYDVAVTACLIVAKQYLGNSITVTSDGTACNWFDAKLACQMTLGYGMTFELETASLFS